MEIVNRDERPWRTIQGVEFRSITVVAHKGKQGPCLERKQAVIYRGPWRKVTDDDGQIVLEFPFTEALIDMPAQRITKH